MLIREPISRRTFASGAASLALVGCGVPATSDNQNRPDPEKLVDNIETILFVLSLATGPYGRAIATFLGLRRFAAFAARMAPQIEYWGPVISDGAQLIARIVQWHQAQTSTSYGLASRENFRLASMQGALPSGDSDGTSPPIAFANNVTAVNVSGENKTRTDHLTYNVYSCVRRLDVPPPATFSEFQDSASLPTFSLSLPVGGAADHQLPVALDVGVGHVLYTYQIESGQEPATTASVRDVILGPFIFATEEEPVQLDAAIQQWQAEYSSDISSSLPTVEHTVRRNQPTV